MSEAASDLGSLSRRRPSVLLVEDNAAGRQGMARVLEARGYAVSAVGRGDEALAILANGPPPEVVLTDLMLPDLDGREVARVARRQSPTPKVALLTGWSLDADDPIFDDVDTVFLKPIRLDDLLAYVDLAVRGRAEPS